ncbi:hypothetical protein [Ornithinimicrobium sp. W1665]|uniref:hypothetical protein n=1 Tax=Ornithinimicrobium sp. W1665 TaxID=3416666 RepID=UPI003D6A6849
MPTVSASAAVASAPTPTAGPGVRPGATVPESRPGQALRPAAASTLAPGWLHGRPVPARVVAVFDVAVYLHRDEDVLPLLAPGALALPGGLRVADRTDLDALRLTVGDRSRWAAAGCWPATPGWSSDGPGAPSGSRPPRSPPPPGRPPCPRWPVAPRSRTTSAPC